MKPIKITSLLTLLVTLQATAAERNWDGGDATSNMTAAANWNGNTAITPAADDLNFLALANAADKVVNNNYPVNTEFRRLDFYDGGYLMTGTIMGLTNGIGTWHNSGEVALNASFTLLGPQTFGTNSDGDLRIGGQIFLSGQSLVFRAKNAASRIDVDGVLSGGNPSELFIGNPTGDNLGEVYFNGAKSFTAPVTIRKGAALVANDVGSLGTGAGTTTLSDGSLVLDSAAALTLPESILMNNADPVTTWIVSKGGAHTLSGPIAFSGDHSFKRFDVQGTSLTLSGVISGPETFGSMLKTGSGRLTLSGAVSNTFGIQIFNAFSGETFLNKSGGAIAISSPFVGIGNNGGPPDSAILRLGASHQIADDTVVTVNSDGWLDLNGRQEAIDWLIFQGPGRVTTGAGALQIQSNVRAFSAAENGGTATITGPLTLGESESEWEVFDGNNPLLLTANSSISQALPGSILRKIGGGHLQLNGNHTISKIRCEDGSLTLTGNSPLTDVELAPAGSANLYASDSIGKLTATGGTVRVGADNSIATLNCRNLSLASAVMWNFTGAQPGGHDEIRVTGTVNLTGVSWGFNNVGPYTTLPGDEVVLISNDGMDPIIGQSVGFPEGSLMNGHLVSYSGGDGNDFTLTRIIAPTGTTRLWDGGGADDNWMTANNWSPNGTPQPGDDLSFPTVASRKINNNNFPVGTTFNSITVNGTGYTIGGNRIMLNETLSFTSANANLMWSAPLTLALPATISSTGNTLVQITSEIQTNGKTLTVHHAGGGTGTLLLGNISGTGGVRKTGPGVVTYFEQPSTYTGNTSVTEGTLALKATATLGASGPANTTTIHPGATLLLRNNEGAVNLAESLILHDGAIITDGTGGAFFNTISGPISLLSGTATIGTASAITYISSTISGSGGLRKNGIGILRFFGAQPNTFSGGFIAEEGRTQGNKSNGPAFPGPVTVGGAPGLYPNLELEANHQIGDNAAVRVAATGALRPGGFSDTIGSLTLQGGNVPETGTLTLQTGLLTVEASPSYLVTLYCNVTIPPGVTGQFTIANGNNLDEADLAFDGILKADTLEQSGPGSMTWYGDQPGGSLGSLKIKSGISIINGQCPSLPVILQGGTIAGKGRVASITTLTSGGLRPGEDIGVFNNTRFLSVGTVTLNAATTCFFRLEGTSPAVDYNQLFPSTAITLGGAMLNLTCINGFEPALGDSFMIIRSITGSPPTGTFANAPEGGYVSAPGAKIFQITYAGGDGDDVVLTRVAGQSPIVVEHTMAPGTGENKGKHQTNLIVKGTPGLTYQLETSTDLQTWTVQQSVNADLLTGLMQLEFFNPETDPRLFLRVRLP